MTYAEIQAASQRADAPKNELLIASFLAKAIQEGEERRRSGVLAKPALREGLTDDTA